LDTGTHFIMGIGLAGLAQLDPVVAGTPGMSEAVMIATILSSQVPDLDTLYRIKGNSFYIRNHRGASHSLPALPIYGLGSTILISFLYTDIPLFHIFLWSMIAVLIHVFTDLLNGYGTKAFLPFTDKWVSWNVLPIFDAFIFTSHLAGILLWFLGFSPGPLFAGIYGLIALYILWRMKIKKRMQIIVKRSILGDGELHLFPNIHPYQWNYIHYNKERIKIGEVRNQTVLWEEMLSIDQMNHPAVETAKQDPHIQNFLHFSRFAYMEFWEREFGYEVRWVDLRYRNKRNMPLLAVIYLNKNYQMIDRYVGWKKEENVTKKLQVSLE
jgi:inner membrane protein